MTTYELRQLREEMQQSPRSMAAKLGISVHTYYLWERGRDIPQYFALAIKFLAAQDLPADPTLRRKATIAYKTGFSKGARFGRLVVVGSAPKAGVSRHSRVKILCDCGAEKEMRTSCLTAATQCSRQCRLNGSPLPPPEVTPYKPYAPAAHPSPPPPPDCDPDEPDLDAPDIEWLKYHARKEKEPAARQATSSSDTPAPPPADEEEWEEGL